MPLLFGKTPIPVLFENDSCLVLNKPTGLSVQGGKGVKVSLDSILSENCSPRPFLVHRLDRDTSGIILVAKTKEAARIFSALFAGGETGAQSKRRVIIKKYLGVCSGSPKPEQGVIRLGLDVKAKGRKEAGRAMVCKVSETSYRIVSTGDVGGIDCSLLELELGTGRMHQIRRHLALIGHPLLGDDKYGDFPLNRQLRKAVGLKHLLLHASRLIIPALPELSDGLDIEVLPPDYFFSNSLRKGAKFAENAKEELRMKNEKLRIKSKVKGKK